MSITFCNYPPLTGYTDDFHRVSDLLFRVDQSRKCPVLIDWVFWEWSTARDAYKADALARIGLWEDGGRLVAATVIEDHMGAVSLCVDPDYRHLRPEMARYALEHMAQDGKITLIIEDGDRELQQLALAQGLCPTQSKESTAVLDITDESTRYTLPEGFHIQSFDREFDVSKYNRVLWKGFDHEAEGPAPQDEGMMQWRRNCVSSPHTDRSLLIAVVAPDGEYAAHCGMWYRGGELAVVEPVATVPQYRRMGLGRAAVLEAARRCGTLGARRASVGSSQQFYYSLGFCPAGTETFWQKSL